MSDPRPDPPRVASTGPCCGDVPGGKAGSPQVVACMLCPNSIAYWRDQDRPAKLVVRPDPQSGRFLLGHQVGV